MRAFLAAAALGLAACGSAPPVEHPEFPVDVPRAWTAPGAADGRPPGRWWTGFGDPALDALVGEALGKNFSLQAAAGRVHSALAQARIAGADLSPHLAASARGSRQRQNFVGFPIPGGADVLSTTYNSFGLSLDLSWELDLWGRLRARHSAALADVEAEAADYEAARLSLAARVSAAYFAVIAARRQVELARSTLESNRATTERIRDRYRRGLRPALDLRLSEANLSSSEATLRFREAQLDPLVRQLELLLGRYPSGRIGTGATLPEIRAGVPAGLPSELLRRRPDMAAAERRLAASRERVSEAVASLFPQFRLTASGGTASDELSDLADGDFRVWSLAGNLLAPLLQGGRLRAGVALAEAVEHQAFALYAEAALRAFNEVETALASEAALAARERALAEAVELSRSAHALSQRRYAGGLIDIVSLLDVQRRLFLAESELVQVRRARLEARINLLLALGGGIEEAP